MTAAVTGFMIDSQAFEIASRSRELATLLGALFALLSLLVMMHLSHIRASRKLHHHSSHRRHKPHGASAVVSRNRAKSC